MSADTNGGGLPKSTVKAPTEGTPAAGGTAASTKVATAQLLTLNDVWNGLWSFGYKLVISGVPFLLLILASML